MTKKGEWSKRYDFCIECGTTTGGIQMTTTTSVFPGILSQINQEPEEAYWFVWDRETDTPWAEESTDIVWAFAFESDAAHVAAKDNGYADCNGLILDGYPRQATVKEAKAAHPIDYPVGLFDRDLNLIKVIG